MHYFENYCTDCGWSASTEDPQSHAAVGREAIEHYAGSGHSIESCSITYPVVVTCHDRP